MRFQPFEIVEGAVVKCSRVILGSNRSKRIEGDFCCDVDRPQGKDKVDHFCSSLVFASLYSTDSTKVILPQILFTQDLVIHNSCEESDASNNEQTSLIFFTFLYMVRTVSLVNDPQT